MARAYDPMAWIYNRYWGQRATERFLPILERLLLPHLPSHARILDLCCGTGQLARALSERGYRVTGLDESEAMIRFARRNAPDVPFLVADARRFHMPPIYHAVVSTYDSLNHVMTLEDLARVFQNVAACLQEGGFFLFDLNMEAGYQARWRGAFGIVEEDHAFVIRAAFNERQRVGRFALTLFRLEEGVWRRSDVTLEQRCYTEPEVASALEAAGFTDLQVYDAQTDLGWPGEVGRAFFRARKA